MIWSLETDDFRGTCNEGKNPLLTKINEIWLQDGSSGIITTVRPKPTVTQTTSSPTSTSTSKPVTTTTSVPITSKPQNGVCSDNGYIRAEDDCNM